MAADGTWNLVMQTPIGDRKATLTLTGTGAISGSLSAEGNTTQIFDGKETGKLTQPADVLSLSFSADKTRLLLGRADNLGVLIEVV